jgi:hypothetical protein
VTIKKRTTSPVHQEVIKKILLGFVAEEDYFEWFLISTLYIAGVRFTVNPKAFTIL